MKRAIINRLTPLIIGLLGDDKLTKRMVELRLYLIYSLVNCLFMLLSTLFLEVSRKWWIAVIGGVTITISTFLFMFIGDVVLEILYGRGGGRDSNGDVNFIDQLIRAFHVPKDTELS